MFEKGFLGTQASFYMDVTTLYFAILPLLLFISIRFAIKKEYSKHIKSQIFILLITLITVLVFEVGVRLENGFLEYSKNSPIPFSFLFAFLTIHINIALVSIVAWIYVIISTYKIYNKDKMVRPNMNAHKRLGKIVFTGLTISSIMGVLLYIFLFVV